MTSPLTVKTSRTASRVAAAQAARWIFRELMCSAPFQPATNLWRAIELSALAPQLPPFGQVLDVGCGDGQVMRLLREATNARWNAVGIDVDRDEAALARHSRAYERVHVAAADHIPEADGAFDLAVANSVLEHVRGLESALHEIARCLAPGGLLAATVPSAEFHELLAGPSRFSRRPRGEYLLDLDRRLSHVNYWSPRRWQDELLAAGFDPPAMTEYLSKNQLQHWETWSNWTGGLLYAWNRRRRLPVAIQRSMGLRRAFPRPLGLLGYFLGTAIAPGVFDDEERPSDGEPLACYLILARKSGR